MISDFKEKELRKKILADKYNRLVFCAARGNPVYIVGGYLRDMLRGEDNSDRDYVAGGDFESLILRIAEATGGKLIRLGDYLGRIVLKNNSTLDFSPLVDCISHDLSCRDFTINSLAWSPETGIIDPYVGLRDLYRKSIKLIHRDNIESDPVRILRAYRLAGRLSFRISHTTRKAIKELSPKIMEAKNERITLELVKIFNLEGAVEILTMMARDGILQYLFPLSRLELDCKLKAISRVSKIINALPLKYKKILFRRCPQDLSCLGMLRLEALLEGLSITSLTLSSIILRKLSVIESVKAILPAGSMEWSRSEIFEAFSLLGDTSIDFLVLTDRTDLLPEYERYCRIINGGLLTAEEVISITGFTVGPNIGRSIKKIRKAEFNYEISSCREAVILLKKYAASLT